MLCLNCRKHHRPQSVDLFMRNLSRNSLKRSRRIPPAAVGGFVHTQPIKEICSRGLFEYHRPQLVIVHTQPNGKHSAARSCYNATQDLASLVPIKPDGKQRATV